MVVAQAVEMVQMQEHITTNSIVVPADITLVAMLATQILSSLTVVLVVVAEEYK